MVQYSGYSMGMSVRKLTNHTKGTDMPIKN